MKDVAFQLAGEIDDLFLLLGSKQDGKAILSCYISKNLVEEKNFNAGKIVRELGKHIQGGGGGQAFFATAGGKNPKALTKHLMNLSFICKSHKNKILKAKEQGYRVTLLFFWLNNVKLAKERVKSRVKEGGHNIPNDVIKRRYFKGIKNLFNIFLNIV